MFQKKKHEKLIEVNSQEWFIVLDHQQVGPFAILDLKKHPRFTPDTLVWKKGYKEWTKARFVPELQDIFKDQPESHPLHEKEEDNLETDIGPESQATLTLQQDPYQLLLWILLLVIVIFYTLYYH